MKLPKKISLTTIMALVLLALSACSFNKTPSATSIINTAAKQSYNLKTLSTDSITESPHNKSVEVKLEAQKKPYITHNFYYLNKNLQSETWGKGQKVYSKVNGYWYRSTLQNKPTNVFSDTNQDDIKDVLKELKTKAKHFKVSATSNTYLLTSTDKQITQAKQKELLSTQDTKKGSKVESIKQTYYFDKKTGKYLGYDYIFQVKSKNGTTKNTSKHRYNSLKNLNIPKGVITKAKKNMDNLKK